MSWQLLLAGALALFGAAVHGILGDRIVRRIADDALPRNRFRGISTKFLIRVTWHITTIAFLVPGIGLVLVGAEPGAAAATGVAYVAAAAFLSWSVLAFIAGFKHGGLQVFLSHPAPAIFLLTGALAAWGAAGL